MYTVIKLDIQIELAFCC